MNKFESFQAQIKQTKEKYGDEVAVRKYDDIVLALSNPYLSLFMIENIEGCNIEAHENIIFESKEAELFFKLAKINKTSNLEKIQKALITTGNVYYINLFRDAMQEVLSEKNIDILTKAIIQYTKTENYRKNNTTRIKKKNK